jgi:hypothetical protein
MEVEKKESSEEISEEQGVWIPARNVKSGLDVPVAYRLWFYLLRMILRTSANIS